MPAEATWSHHKFSPSGVITKGQGIAEQAKAATTATATATATTTTTTNLMYVGKLQANAS